MLNISNKQGRDFLFSRTRRSHSHRGVSRSNQHPLSGRPLQTRKQSPSFLFSKSHEFNSCSSVYPTSSPPTWRKSTQSAPQNHTPFPPSTKGTTTLSRATLRPTSSPSSASSKSASTPTHPSQAGFSSKTLRSSSPRPKAKAAGPKTIPSAKCTALYTGSRAWSLR